MTPAERGEFKRMKDEGRVTIFDIAFCGAVDCEEEVPKKAKTFCSVECFKREEGLDGDEEKAEEEAWSMD